jgi:ankyrin repeat protein
MTVFMHACNQSAGAVLRDLLESDSAPANDADSTGWTALHWAVSCEECALSLLLSFVT